MRKADMEWVELHLKGLAQRIDSVEAAISAWGKDLERTQSRIKDMKRDHKSNVLAVDQACNSARSLLQQANRAARAAKLIQDEEPFADTGTLEKIAATEDDRMRLIREAHPGKNVL